jgi:hypothetical protein
MAADAASTVSHGGRLSSPLPNRPLLLIDPTTTLL